MPGAVWTLCLYHRRGRGGLRALNSAGAGMAGPCFDLQPLTVNRPYMCLMIASPNAAVPSFVAPGIWRSKS